MVASMNSVALVTILLFNTGEIYEPPVEMYTNWRDCIVRSMDVASMYRKSSNIKTYKVQCVPVKAT